MTDPVQSPSSSTLPSRRLAWRSLGIGLFGAACLVVGVALGPRLMSGWERLSPSISSTQSPSSAAAESAGQLMMAPPLKWCGINRRCTPGLFNPIQGNVLCAVWI